MGFLPCSTPGPGISWVTAIAIAKDAENLLDSLHDCGLDVAPDLNGFIVQVIDPTINRPLNIIRHSEPSQPDLTHERKVPNCCPYIRLRRLGEASEEFPNIGDDNCQGSRLASRFLVWCRDRRNIRVALSRREGISDTHYQEVSQTIVTSADFAGAISQIHP